MPGQSYTHKRHWLERNGGTACGYIGELRSIGGETKLLCHWGNGKVAHGLAKRSDEVTCIKCRRVMGLDSRARNVDNTVSHGGDNVG